MVKYLISKIGDPLFALFVGVGAAAVRVKREEEEAGRTPAEAWNSFVRRGGYSFGWAGGQGN
ncbi:hypothetical protein DFP73DRAFT_555890 [Morchella snyderi]|nr:hypothetical protein DFP73DRAFT_555890 [Morchella snyderi]